MKKKSSNEQKSIIILIGFVLPVVLLTLMEIAVYTIARLM